MSKIVIVIVTIVAIGLPLVFDAEKFSKHEAIADQASYEACMAICLANGRSWGDCHEVCKPQLQES